MRVPTILGVVLVIAGTLALVYQGISYTTEDQVADLGIIEIRETDTETIPLPPIIGGAVLLAGVALIFFGAAGRSKL